MKKVGVLIIILFTSVAHSNELIDFENGGALYSGVLSPRYKSRSSGGGHVRAYRYVRYFEKRLNIKLNSGIGLLVE